MKERRDPRLGMPRRSCRSDLDAISALGAIGIVGLGLGLTIGGLAITQADILGSHAEPATDEAIQALTLNIRVGEVLGHVHREGDLPEVDRLVISGSVGVGTDAFDLRSLTLRVVDQDDHVIVPHEAGNGTDARVGFSVRPVRDMDGSLSNHVIGYTDRVDFILDLTELDMTLTHGEDMTVWFHTDAGTALRLRIEAPRSLASESWIEMETEVLNGA